MFRMFWNIKDGLHYLGNESVSMKVFILNMHETMDFIRSGQSYTSFNLLRILNFFYENYWSRLPESSKCRRSIRHGDIRFWFSRNAYTCRHCLLLQIHLSYYTRCIKRFKKIADTSFNINRCMKLHQCYNILMSW